KKFKKNSILKAWLMENVPNSQNFIEESYTFSDLDLDEWAKSQGINPRKVAIRAKNNGGILHSDDYGSPQVRKRFVCGEYIPNGEFPYPDITNFNNKVTLNRIFKNFPKPLSKIANKRIQDPNYPSEMIDSKELRDHFYDSGIYQVQWQKARDAKQNHPYMGKMSFPENMEKPSRTIMATMSASTREAIIYKSELNRKGDGEYRTPTIREAAIIMGFPINYQFYGNESTKWRLVGNAVCVQLSYALALKILE
ncbi:TPA: DNA cytosine methyltransferase, partial [Streptococcus suis]|nr:DNA cytosine methyltransferase [Streptococcus suis]